jgi:hypothetical protein
MRTSIILALLLFSSSAIAQLSTIVGSAIHKGTVLCQKHGTRHAACSDTWKSTDGEKEVSGGGTANADYGTLGAHGKVIINCSTRCSLNAQTVSTAEFTDTANIQNAPSGSFFLIRISLSGSESNVNTSLAFELNLNNTASCVITADKGTCDARVPVAGSTASFGFTAELVGSVDAILDGSPGTAHEDLTLYGHISELAVVDADGNVLKDVVITTASGHKYPE